MFTHSIVLNSDNVTIIGKLIGKSVIEKLVVFPLNCKTRSDIRFIDDNSDFIFIFSELMTYFNIII